MKTDISVKSPSIDWEDERQAKVELRRAMKLGGSRAVYDLIRAHNADVRIGIDVVNEYMESPEMKLRRTFRSRYQKFAWLRYFYPSTWRENHSQND